VLAIERRLLMEVSLPSFFVALISSSMKREESNRTFSAGVVGVFFFHLEFDSDSFINFFLSRLDSRLDISPNHDPPSPSP